MWSDSVNVHRSLSGVTVTAVHLVDTTPDSDSGDVRGILMQVTDSVSGLACYFGPSFGFTNLIVLRISRQIAHSGIQQLWRRT